MRGVLALAYATAAAAFGSLSAVEKELTRTSYSAVKPKTNKFSTTSRCYLQGFAAGKNEALETLYTVSTVDQLEKALNAAEEMIVLKPGIYKLTKELEILGDVTLWAYRPGSVILDGQKDTRVLKIGSDSSDFSPKVRLHGIDITNGNSRQEGGGVFIKNGEVSFLSCNIYDNEAYMGGGVYVENGQVTFLQTNIYQNEAYYGGGVRIKDGIVNFKECQIYKNEADGYGGGGVYVRDGTVKFQGCNIYSNKADYEEGGGVYVYTGQVTFTSSNIHGNTARYGGGVYVQSGEVSFISCNIYENDAWDASAPGGGVKIQDVALGGPFEVKAKELKMWGNLPDDVSPSGSVTSVGVHSIR